MIQHGKSFTKSIPSIHISIYWTGKQNIMNTSNKLRLDSIYRAFGQPKPGRDDPFTAISGLANFGIIPDLEVSSKKNSLNLRGTNKNSEYFWTYILDIYSCNGQLT